MTIRALLPLLKEALEQTPAQKAVIAVTVGSGVGKTCVSALLTYYLNQIGVGAYTLSGDNYLRIVGESTLQGARCGNAARQ